MSVPPIIAETAWTGGFYQLYVEPEGPVGEGRLQRLLTALWASAPVDGCFAEPYGADRALREAPCTVRELRKARRLVGTVLLPGGRRVPCGCALAGGEDGPPLLDLYFPLSALHRADPRVGGFPFDSRSGAESLEWRAPLDAWLAGVARGALGEAGPGLAMIGFELEGAPSEELRGGAPPADRPAAFLVPGSGGPEYVPATR
ncbi:hypothetical protein [Nocardiopsis potens]|uniref:hypothetical protein n=1 Tax=Nocardiopsis potens TaxID=1246458 RepID=UPI0003492795|nr:hypothetical protein [Nocardiopsis potens]